MSPACDPDMTIGTRLLHIQICATVLMLIMHHIDLECGRVVVWSTVSVIIDNVRTNLMCVNHGFLKSGKCRIFPDVFSGSYGRLRFLAAKNSVVSG